MKKILAGAVLIVGILGLNIGSAFAAPRESAMQTVSILTGRPVESTLDRGYTPFSGLRSEALADAVTQWFATILYT